MIRARDAFEVLDLVIVSIVIAVIVVIRIIAVGVSFVAIAVGRLFNFMAVLVVGSSFSTIILGDFHLRRWGVLHTFSPFESVSSPPPEQEVPGAHFSSVGELVLLPPLCSV